MAAIQNQPLFQEVPVGPTTNTPFGAPKSWHRVVEVRARLQCECTGQCGVAHKQTAGRCPRKHEGWHNKRTTRLVLAPKKRGLSLHQAAQLPDGELMALCEKCLSAADKSVKPQQEAFSTDGEIPEEAAEPEPTAALELVTVPHGHGGTFETDFRYIVEEAMRLNDGAGSGRIKFGPGAKLAYWSLLAAGWTPPGDASDDEAARLRKALEATRRELDDLRASTAWAHEAEEKANVRRGGMAATLTRTVASLKELAQIAEVDGKPEPTLPVTKVAAALEKALTRDRR